MKKRALISILPLLGALASGWGCGYSPPAPSGDQATGGIQAALDLGSAAGLSQATYTITGPSNYRRSVTVPLGSTSRLSTFIGGTPPGKGYVLSVAGLAQDGVTMCSGVSAPFDVFGGQTTVVSLVLRCQEAEPPGATGSIQTNGSLNYCPVVDAVMAAPGEAPVGGRIGLTGTAHDKNGAPLPISYGWSATGGVVENATAASATFTCTAVGSVTITFSVHDGDCGDQRSITVSCTVAPASPADAGAPGMAPDAAVLADTGPAAPADPCLKCEASSPEPACATRYNLCVSMAGNALAGPATGTPRKDLCLGLLVCVHDTRCDAGGILRDCFCGKLVDEFTCKMTPTGPCRDAFYAAGETTDNATILARMADPSSPLGVGVSVVEECEEKPEPLCGPWCGH